MKKEKSNSVSYEQVFNAMTDLIAVQDADFNFVMMNDSYRREFKSFFGVVIKVGDNMFEKIGSESDQAKSMKEMWTQAYQSGNFDVVQKFIGSDKKEGVYSIHFDALFDGAGTQVGMLHVVRNITKQNNLASKLEESEARFKGAFETSAVGMALISPEGTFLEANKALQDFLGYTEKELKTKTFQEVTHDDDLQEDLKFVEEMLEGVRESYRMEKRYIKKDGSVVYAQLSVSMVRNASGKVMYFVSQIQDIGARKQIEDATKRSIDELARMNKALVGREVKMRELKEELRACKEKQHESV